MGVYNNKIYDFVSLYGGEAFIFNNLNLQNDWDYVSFIKNASSNLMDMVNPFIDRNTPIINQTLVESNTEVINGVWTTVCTMCNNRVVIRRLSNIYLCVKCCIDADINEFYRLNWRVDWRDVERVLLARPNSLNRNALYTETIRDLVQENREYLG